jgi:hypothetical protein
MNAVAVAAPVRGPRNDVIAAISAVVATNETPLDRLAARLTSTAHAISHALGAPNGRPGTPGGVPSRTAEARPRPISAVA